MERRPRAGEEGKRLGKSIDEEYGGLHRIGLRRKFLGSWTSSIA